MPNPELAVCGYCRLDDCMHCIDTQQSDIPERVCGCPKRGCCSTVVGTKARKKQRIK